MEEKHIQNRKSSIATIFSHVTNISMLKIAQVRFLIIKFYTIDITERRFI